MEPAIALTCLGGLAVVVALFSELIRRASSLMVAASVLAHGVSAHPFTMWLGRREGEGARGDASEPDLQDESRAAAGSPG